MTRRNCLLHGWVPVLLLALAFPAPSSAQAPPPFDFDHGNAPIEVVIPFAVPAILETVSRDANDATLVLRITTIVANAWFDAAAPYHPTAVGVYSRLGRRPPHERTDRNRNIATIYASYRVLNSLLPQHAEDWRQMLLSVGLDPDDDRRNRNSPIGIGNRAGHAIVRVREHDGMNQLGDEGGRIYNRQPYADYTGYQPVNTAYELIDAGRWQPNFATGGNGIFRIQQFVTPQLRLTRPHSFEDPAVFSSPPPVNSTPGTPGYQQQADEVLAVSAGLTDYQKMAAELFDNKLASLGFSAGFAWQSRGLGLQEWIEIDFITNAAAFDSGIVTWQEKTRWDAVRPFSAIRFLYGDGPVTAWGGPGEGTVTDLPASQWRSYLTTADHPEYPSASACFCAAHSQAARRYFGDDVLGLALPAPAGSSRIEPGVTPAVDLLLGPWPTWTAFEQECGQSRLWGGVHFQDSITVAQALCPPIGDLVYEFVRDHLDGTAPPPGH